MTDLARFRELFVHREDVFAQQFSDGHYEPVRSALSDDDIAEHLAGFASYGVYVIRPTEERSRMAATDNTEFEEYDEPVNDVKFVVFDLDTYDEAALEHLKWCVQALLPEGWEQIPPYANSLLLESSGGKGYHVWLFLSEPLPAVQVRRWLGWAFWPLWLEADPSGNGWPALEVFPKQDTVDEGGYGNLVKLPLGKHEVTGKRSEFIEVAGWGMVATRVNTVVPLDASLVPALEAQGSTGTGAAVARAETRSGVTPFPCIDRILTGDVYHGIRDEAMFHLALFYYGNGLDQELVTEECLRVNARMERPMTEREIVTKVKSAYSGRHRGSCAPQWLRDFCPGPCPKYGFTKNPTTGALARLKAGDLVEVEVTNVQASGGKKRLTLRHPDAENSPTLIVG